MCLPVGFHYTISDLSYCFLGVLYVTRAFPLDSFHSYDRCISTPVHTLQSLEYLTSLTGMYSKPHSLGLVLFFYRYVPTESYIVDTGPFHSSRSCTLPSLSDSVTPSVGTPLPGRHQQPPVLLIPLLRYNLTRLFSKVLDSVISPVGMNPR